MDKDLELLNYVYQNSEMGIITIEQLLQICKDEHFKQQLESQCKEYKSINDASKKLMTEKNGNGADGIGAFEKIRTYLMINMQTLTDKSTPRIAEMMIIGSNMGVIEAIKNIKKYESADHKALDLMKKLLAFEENNIQTLKTFLV